MAVTALLMMSASRSTMRARRGRETTLQNAVDAVVLGVAREAHRRDLRRNAQADGERSHGDDAPGNYDFEVTSLTTTGGTLTITAEGSIPAGLTTIAGYRCSSSG